MDGRSGNLFSVWRRGNCQAEFTPGLLPDGCNWAESIVRYSRQVNQRGNLNCERAAASLFGWDANAGFHVRSRTTYSPVSFRMAGLWQSSLFLARQEPSLDLNILSKQAANGCWSIAVFFKAHKSSASGISSHCQWI